jgi:ubiquinone/menaquinone biosynthesis C-methylase UbiE
MDPRRYGKRSAILYRWIIDPLAQPLRPKIVSLCLKYGMRHVLDIGCATGAQCRQLATAGIQATGLDLSEAMVASARARSPETVTFVIGSAYEMPFADDEFDAAILSLALHEHSEADRTQMVSEALRVVRQDGYLVLAEYSKPARTLFHVPWRIIQLIENLAGGDHRAGFREFIATDGLHGLLRRHDLDPVEMVHSHFHTMTIAVVQPRVR